MSNIFDDVTDYETMTAFKAALDELFGSEGWRIISDFIEERCSVRERELIQMCPESMEQCVRFAKQRGAIDELRLLPTMLQQMYSDAETEIKKLQTEMEAEDSAIETDGEDDV